MEFNCKTQAESRDNITHTVSAELVFRVLLLAFKVSGHTYMMYSLFTQSLGEYRHTLNVLVLT